MTKNRTILFLVGGLLMLLVALFVTYTNSQKELLQNFYSLNENKEKKNGDDKNLPSVLEAEGFENASINSPGNGDAAVVFIHNGNPGISHENINLTTSQNVVSTNLDKTGEPKSYETEFANYAKVNDFKLIDQIGQFRVNGVNGVDGCVSFGYTDSKGDICFSPEMIEKMQSRGGNATGKI